MSIRMADECPEPEGLLSVRYTKLSRAKAKRSQNPMPCGANSLASGRSLKGGERARKKMSQLLGNRVRNAKRFGKTRTRGTQKGVSSHCKIAIKLDLDIKEIVPFAFRGPIRVQEF